MGTPHYTLSLLAFVCGIISAKWAMELGFSQLRQVIWGVAGLLLGPVALLLLYIRLLIAWQESRDAEPHAGDRGAGNARGNSIAATNQPAAPTATSTRHCDWVDGEGIGTQRPTEL